MRGRILLTLMLTANVAWPQVAPSATGGSPGSQSDMMTPPPISGTGYPTEVAQTQTNYLSGGITTTTAYVNNLYAGNSGTSIPETTVSIFPTFSYSAISARRQTVVNYSPGFTFYQPSSALNEVDNRASLSYSFRPTQHMTLTASDNFQDSSSPFNPGIAGTDNTVTGSGESSTPGAIPPFAKRLTNSANVELTLQTGPNAMVGASGLESVLHYPDPSQTPGLYDSNSRGGTVFYNRRISLSQYFGATYQYLDMLAFPSGSTDTTRTQTITGFYTFYPTKKLSLSVSGGPQYYQVIQAFLPTTGSWGPSVSASMGWQAARTGFAASYSQSVTGGGGLLGAFHSRSANVSANWQMARTWSGSVSASYNINQTVNSLLSSGEPGGHSVSGHATLEHSMGEQLSITIHYDRVHQSYDDIVALATNPNSDRETFSINWHFQRSLGK